MLLPGGAVTLGSYFGSSCREEEMGGNLLSRRVLIMMFFHALLPGAVRERVGLGGCTMPYVMSPYQCESDVVISFYRFSVFSSSRETAAHRSLIADATVREKPLQLHHTDDSGVQALFFVKLIRCVEHHTSRKKGERGSEDSSPRW